MQRKLLGMTLIGAGLVLFATVGCDELEDIEIDINVPRGGYYYETPAYDYYYEDVYYETDYGYFDWFYDWW